MSTPTDRLRRGTPETVVRARVLVVDDDRNVMKALGRLLADHDVTFAESGREALERCAETSFDLILCDVIMPGLSGRDVFNNLLATRPDAARRIVFITGGAFTGEMQAFLEAHTTRWISKPFDAEAVRTAVQGALARLGPVEKRA